MSRRAPEIESLDARIKPIHCADGPQSLAGPAVAVLTGRPRQGNCRV